MATSQQNKILITCAKFTGEYLASELKDHGFQPKQINSFNVEISGTLQDTYKLNYLLRTASRVLFHIARFSAPNVRKLKQRINDIAWEEFIPLNGYFTVSSFVSHSQIRDTRYPNLVVKDSIADRFVEIFKSRPDSGTSKDQCSIFFYWNEADCEVYLDTTGNSISKHGYRINPWKAPMVESLAASVINASKWDKNSHFVNPMCGSGTLAIEAALISSNLYPGQFRSNYSFMHFKNYDEDAWNKVKSANEKKAPDSVPFKIIATDISKQAIEVAKMNAREAGVDHLIEFSSCPFQKTIIPEGSGVIMLNPEYGERMGEIENLSPIYKEIGDFFKQKGGGYQGYVFTGNQQLAKKIGLRTSRKIPFLNSSIECRLLEYELYSGTRKSKTENEL